MKEKICPRCGTRFICNHDNIAQCQCAAVKLKASTQQFIAKHYNDCLCAKCLTELNNESEGI